MNQSSDIFWWNDLRISRITRRAYFRDRELHLTKLEFELLSLLISNPEQVFSRSQILQAFGIDRGFRADSVVDSHISRIRRKIRALGGPKIIKAIHGMGYRLNE